MDNQGNLGSPPTKHTLRFLLHSLLSRARQLSAVAMQSSVFSGMEEARTVCKLLLQTMADDLHILFLPFLSPGHIIPMLDLARLFAARGIKATVVTTTGNVPLVKPTVDLANTDSSLRHTIQLLPLRLPCSEAGIPDGYENLTAFADPEADLLRLTAATDRLEPSFSLLLKTHRPDCVVVDLFYPWATRVAQEASIPSLLFHGCNFFSSEVIEIATGVELNQGDLEAERSIEVPGIPQKIHLKLSDLPNLVLHPNEFCHRMTESLDRIHGTVVNSFYELERDYVDRAPNSQNLRLWFVGPVSLQNRGMDTKMARGSSGAAAGRSADHFLSWLETKRPRSVLYVCFGSTARFPATQLHEIARGLEASDWPFIWVVRNAGDTSEWLPEGFENRVISGGKGLLVQGWAPQLLILNHEAVGGFVTHCGWNSCLEAIAAGVPVITWPLFAEQFLNEKLLVDVHRMGISVGATSSCNKAEDRTVVNGERLKEAVDQLMGSEEAAEERRKRARELGEMARRAMEEGGSSHETITRLIQELIRLKAVGLSKEIYGDAVK